MDQLDIAIHSTAMNTPGGMKRLSQLMGMNHQTLINKCCPTTEPHKLTLREGLAMMLQTGDVQILEVMAGELGYTVEPKAVRATKDLMTAILNADAEHGDVGRKIQEAISDHHLTPREVAGIRDEITEAKRALDDVLASVVQLYASNSNSGKF